MTARKTIRISVSSVCRKIGKMADFQKNKRHQRNGDQAEKGHEVNPFIRKNLPEVHAGKSIPVTIILAGPTMLPTE